MKTALLTSLLWLTPQLVLAAEEAAEPSLLYASLKMLAALLLIIGLLLLLFAASKKGFGLKMLPKARGSAIKVVETKPLGGKKFLCIVSVRGEDLLLGLSNERIECLSKLPPAADFSAALQTQIGEADA